MPSSSRRRVWLGLLGARCEGPLVAGRSSATRRNTRRQGGPSPAARESDRRGSLPRDATIGTADIGGPPQPPHLPSVPHLPDAACRQPGVDVAWFFPERGRPTGRAKKVCAGCPAQLDCLEFALSAGDQLHGVWGGLSQTERRRLLREAAISRGLAIVANGPTPEPGAPTVSYPGTDDVRHCRGCRASLAGRPPTAVWCSATCKQRAHHAPANQAAARQQPIGRAQPSVGDADSRLVEVIQMLTHAGLAVAIRVDGVELHVTA